jgi:hypothetical protein
MASHHTNMLDANTVLSACVYFNATANPQISSASARTSTNEMASPEHIFRDYRSPLWQFSKSPVLNTVQEIRQTASIMPSVPKNAGDKYSMRAESEKTVLTSPLATDPRSLNRVGTIASWTIVLTSTATACSITFLGFLWFSNSENSVWHWIVIEDHLITVVTGLSKSIETSIQLQLGLISAMLAAVLLETFHVSLEDVAAVSLARLSGGSVNLLMNLWRQTKHCVRSKRELRSWIVLFLMLVAILTLAFSQVLAVVLNKNIRLAPLSSFNTSSTLSFGFQYDHDAASQVVDPVSIPSNGWSTRLSSFPAFAEYAEDGVDATGVSDTGPRLRAFLPYASAADRQNIQSYLGKTAVVDVRSTCQVPQLVQAEVAAQQGALILRGLVGATTHSPRLDNQTILPVAADNASFAGWKYNDLVPFECTVPTVANETDWRAALCQLPEGGSETSMFSGGLISVFRPPTPLNISDLNYALWSSNWGQAYIFLNATRGSDYAWRGALQGGLDNPPFWSVPAFQHRNEWSDLIFSNGSLVLSATICYTSFATADLPVVMSSTKNRTEPSLSYDFKTARYNYDQVRVQLGQTDKSSTDAERGIMSLEPQRTDWLALPTELPTGEPYIRQYFNMNTGGVLGEDGNWTAMLCQDTSTLTADSSHAFLHVLQPDLSVISLFQQIVTSGGSVAFALQSLYTVMTANIYYNKLPEFDAVANVYRTDFKVVNAPTQRWGFYVVLAMVAVQFGLLAVTLILFLGKTQWTYLGEAWMVVAQTRGMVVDNDVLGAMGDGAVTDEKVGKILKAVGRRNIRVGLGDAVSENRIFSGSTDTASSEGPVWVYQDEERFVQKQGGELRLRRPQIVEWGACR